MTESLLHSCPTSGDSHYPAGGESRSFQTVGHSGQLGDFFQSGSELFRFFNTHPLEERHYR